MFQLQYFNYMSLIKGRYTRPFLIHRAVNFQLNTGKIGSMTKRRNSNMADNSGARATFPWPAPDRSHSCSRQLHGSEVPSCTAGPCFKHILSQYLLPSRYPEVWKSECPEAIFIGQWETRWCSSPFFQKDDSGRCSLQFSKVLEDQNFTARIPNDLDCAFHFGFSFCCLCCLCSLTPTF